MLRNAALAGVLLVMTFSQAFADNGLVTKPSKYGVQETVEKFEAAIKSKAAGGWVLFSRIDHAAAAKQAGLEMRPRTVIIFGNPKGGTPPMTNSATLALDLPMKALVWQDDQDKVWLTYNSSEYGAKVIYPRHGLAVPEEAAKGLEKRPCRRQRSKHAIPNPLCFLASVRPLTLCLTDIEPFGVQCHSAHRSLLISSSTNATPHGESDDDRAANRKNHR